MLYRRGREGRRESYSISVDNLNCNVTFDANS